MKVIAKELVWRKNNATNFQKNVKTEWKNLRNEPFQWLRKGPTNSTSQLTHQINLPPFFICSDAEVAEEAKKQQIREAAGKQVDDSLDAVKLLNSMAARATAFTIRDQQLEEKKRLEHLDKEVDRRTDILIEIDRYILILFLPLFVSMI